MGAAPADESERSMVCTSLVSEEAVLMRMNLPSRVLETDTQKSGLVSSYISSSEACA